MAAKEYFETFVELVNNERYVATYRTYLGREQSLEKEKEEEEQAVSFEEKYISHTERLCFEIEHANEERTKWKKEGQLKRRKILYGVPLGMIPKFGQTVR